MMNYRGHHLLDEPYEVGSLHGATGPLRTHYRCRVEAPNGDWWYAQDRSTRSAAISEGRASVDRSIRSKEERARRE